MGKFDLAKRIDEQIGAPIYSDPADDERFSDAMAALILVSAWLINRSVLEHPLADRHRMEAVEMFGKQLRDMIEIAGTDATGANSRD